MTDDSPATSTVDLPTGRHWRRGRLNVDAEPGTVLGPNSLGEYLVVLERLDDHVTVGFANQKDVNAVADRPEGPRSPAEHRLLWARAHKVARARAVR